MMVRGSEVGAYSSVGLRLMMGMHGVLRCVLCFVIPIIDDNGLDCDGECISTPRANGWEGAAKFGELNGAEAVQGQVELDERRSPRCLQTLMQELGCLRRRCSFAEQVVCIVEAVDAIFNQVIGEKAKETGLRWGAFVVE